MKVSECFNIIPEVNLGYVRMIEYVSGGEAKERTLDSFTTRELYDVQSKDVSAYYSIGEYWYIVYIA